MNWRAAQEVLHALRDAFPGSHPSMTLDRETRTSLIVLLNPAPGVVHQYKLDDADLARPIADVVTDIKALRAQTA
jgi:hypothetical protein